MTPPFPSLLLALLLAHLAGDFLLQCKAWVRSKQRHGYRSVALYLHAAVHTALVLGVLLGTMLSFALTLMLGLALRQALQAL